MTCVQLQDRTQFSDGDLIQLKRYWDRGMTSLGSVCREKITAAANQLSVDTEIVKVWNIASHQVVSGSEPRRFACLHFCGILGKQITCYFSQPRQVLERWFCIRTIAGMLMEYISSSTALFYPHSEAFCYCRFIYT